MHVNIKKCLTSLLAAMLIIISLPILAFAESGVGDKDNSGNGSGGGSVNSAYTWTTSQSGYRFQIIDENFKPIGTTVDLVFSPPNQVTNQDYRYTNSRATALSSDNSKYTRRTIDQIYSTDEFKGAKYPPVPINFIDVNGMSVAQAQGEAFKKWFLSGAGSITRPTISVNSGSSPLTSTNNSSVSSNGTTRPNTQADPKPSNDMVYVSEFTLFADASYREDKHWESFDVTYAQGYYSHAQTVIKAQVTATKNAATFRSIREDKSYNDLVYAEIAESTNYYQSISKSYAEYVYITSSIIRNILGINWEPTDYLMLSQKTDQFNGNTTNKEIDTSIQLENIPLANESTDEGYARKFLNLKENNKFLFDLPGTDISDKSKWVTNVMIEKNYSVIVEDLFWMVPAAANSSGLPTSPIHPNYVYGTVGNFVDFSKNNGYKYGSSGGAYGVILGSLGWRSMFLGEDWVGNGITIKGFGELTGKKSLSDLSSMIGNNEGIAMHIYTTEDNSTQTTRDLSKGSAAHPAPDPSSLAGTDKKYRIVKYYEQELSDGTIDRNKFITINNPPKIKINDEIKYRLKDWFISTSDSDGNTDYSSSKSSLSSTRTGTKAETVELKDGELTLHMLLTKGPEAQAEAGPLTLGESEISKAITTMNDTIPNWGPRIFTFNYASMSDSHSHPVGLGSVSCSTVWGDSAYNYIISNSATLDDQLEANAVGGGFASKMITNTKSGNANMGGGSNTLDTAEYQTTLWRGLDVPTIASYKEPSTIDLGSLLGRYGKEPVGDRGINGSYNKSLSIQLDVDAASDVTTHTNHSYNGNSWHTSTHTAAAVNSHSGTVNVNVFRGTNSKSEGRETNASVIPTVTPFGATSSMHSAGYMVQGIHPMYFYPYIRMSYQTTGSNVKNNVNVLSQFYSAVLPNNTAECAWYNQSEESLAMSSTQWSLHAKATNAGKSWNGANQVLPGGAIFQLGTRNTPTRVALVTWQTLVTGNERAALSVTLPANEYTLSSATAEHNQYVSEAKTVLEGLNVVQWVNADPEALNAWTNNGKSVKITGGNQSLNALGLNTQTSTEAKYRLQPDGSADAANEADLDVISSTDSQDTFFKVIASPDGSIYLAKSIGDINALSAITGTNPNNSGSATVTKILGKNVKWDTVDSNLTDADAKALNQRTLLITNFIKALERDKGNDKTAWWSPDGHWFNESFDGIIVCRKATILEVGFNKPNVRSAVLDTRIMPPSSGIRDNFERAFLSQFRVDSKSENAKDKQNGYIASFKGRDVFIKNIENLYVSKKFYVPNVSVQDLNN